MSDEMVTITRREYEALRDLEKRVRGATLVAQNHLMPEVAFTTEGLAYDLQEIDAARKPRDYRDEAVEVCREIVIHWDYLLETGTPALISSSLADTARRVVEAAGGGEGRG